MAALFTDSGEEDVKPVVHDDDEDDIGGDERVMRSATGSLSLINLVSTFIQIIY